MVSPRGVNKLIQLILFGAVFNSETPICWDARPMHMDIKQIETRCRQIYHERTIVFWFRGRPCLAQLSLLCIDGHLPIAAAISEPKLRRWIRMPVANRPQFPWLQRVMYVHIDGGESDVNTRKESNNGELPAATLVIENSFTRIWNMRHAKSDMHIWHKTSHQIFLTRWW